MTTTDFRVRQPGTRRCCNITVLGNQSVDGHRSVSTRTLEFLLAIALAGGERRQSSLLRDLFSDCASKSAIPTLAYRARKLGIETEFIPVRGSYRVLTPMVIDAVELLAALRAGDVRTALWLYGGPCLANSRSPLAIETREMIDMRLIRAVLATGDRAFIEFAATKLDAVELRSGR
ncbi:hypothetical protein [Nocardia vaccinii]|uniref:hypothetical protein n=1 Tax=Nocardia vaccinii TaxID=1822 RepID=UPI000B2CA2FD|nr:hypothetical protein [Nocardia vaccinii]